MDINKRMSYKSMPNDEQILKITKSSILYDPGVLFYLSIWNKVYTK